MMIYRNIWEADFPLNPIRFTFALDAKTGVMRIKFERYIQWPRDVWTGWIKQRPTYHIDGARIQFETGGTRTLSAEQEAVILTAFNREVRWEVGSIRKALKYANQA